ncbi:hypothetical protein MAPG_02651 [Magnaporthiopsis poae ATCC 64411]|uniref:SWIM-type domain-containing protein n=1 Tax=Magnaporthiopsis poae (strain ATCC 64411 / 73-15) TaxID=644358 RepID=A0A0C4DRY3_MAGP6|nr:hypothetical protein MAPG_02651 [Magnaporthiopsis poae ATCC 64411]
MPPTTRSQAHRLIDDTAVAPTTEYHEDASDSESELDDLDTDNIVRSPFTGIMYDISQLPTGGDSGQGAGDSQQGQSRVDPGDQDRDVQGRIKELFRKLSNHESPPINLQFCGLGEEDGGEFYAFQLREITPLSIRIGTPTSRWSEPHCSCRNRKPCQHLMWLYDAISGLALDSRDDSRPLVVDRAGRIPGMEDPFSTIAEFRLDLLTKGLHCGVGGSYEYGNRDWFREMEADEILLALEGSSSESEEGESDLDRHRHQSPSKRRRPAEKTRPHKKSRLEKTVRELLVQNNEVFSVFLNMLSPRDKVRNLYSRLQDRVDAAGGRDGGLFVVDQLRHVLDQTQHADRLEDIKKMVRTKGAPAAYLDRLEEVAAGMRSIQSRQGSAVPYSPSVSSSSGGGAGTGPSVRPTAAGSKRPWEGDH